MVIFYSLLTVLATLLGGLFALKQKDKHHLILSFSAGTILGVAFFDLMPEALNLGGAKYSSDTLLLFIAFGFVIFMLLDRFVSLHYCHDGEDCHNLSHRGTLGATTLSLHSFLDGLAIGLAFKVSPAIGAVVTAAVLAHDFSDGINTVSVVIINKGSIRSAYQWLLADAIAPALGAGATLFFTLSGDKLGLLLAIFSGLFLYLGASDIVPEGHHDHPTVWTTAATVLGMGLILLIVRLASL